MLWNAATHGLSIPRDGGDKAAGTAKRRAQPGGTGFSSRGAHGVRFLRRRAFLERRGPLGAASSGRRRNPVADAFDRALGGIREGTDDMAEQRRKDGDATQGHRRTTPKPVCRTAKARGQSRGLESARAERSASLAMRRRLVAPRAVLLQLKTIRRIATVLLRDVVALLAVLAGEGDLGANILRLASHFLTPLVLSTKRGPLRDRSGGGA